MTKLPLICSLGFACFDVHTHDRSVRAAHRLAVDHPQAVFRLILLGVAPTLAMYEQANDAFACACLRVPPALLLPDPADFAAESGRFKRTRSPTYMT